MEMNGGGTASYLACTARDPVSMLILLGLKAKGLLDFQGRSGITSIVRWNLRRSMAHWEIGTFPPLYFPMATVHKRFRNEKGT